MYLTKEQLARLEQLKSNQNLTPAEKAELDFLSSLSKDTSPEKENQEQSKLFFDILLEHNDEFIKLIRNNDHKAFIKASTDVLKKAARSIFEDDLSDTKCKLHLVDKLDKINIDSFANEVLPVTQETPEKVKEFLELLSNQEDKKTVDSVSLKYWYLKTKLVITNLTLITLINCPAYFTPLFFEPVALTMLEGVLKELRKQLPQELQDLLPEDQYTTEEFYVAFGLLKAAIDNTLRTLTILWSGMYTNDYTKFGSYQELGEVSETFINKFINKSNEPSEETRKVVETILEAFFK